jgi:hypothetical protein
MRQKIVSLLMIGLLSVAFVSSVPAQEGGHTFCYGLS